MSKLAETTSAPPKTLSLPTGESDLFRRAKGGDRAAFGQIVRLFQDRLYNSLLRVVGNADEALELTQETFTRALQKMESFRGEAQPYTWLFRIGLNLAISQLRKVQRHRTFSLDAPIIANDHVQSADQAASLVERVAANRQPSPADEVESRERSQQVLSALAKIDVDYRAVLIMRDVEGFDYQQMADVLGLPLGTLKSRLFRARVALRDELMPYMRKDC